MQVFLVPAVLTTKQCHDYVGGLPVWRELLAAHGDILLPVRTTQRGDSYYRRDTVDKALLQAELSGTLIHRSAEDQDEDKDQEATASRLLISKQSRRFRRPSVTA